MEFPLIGGFAFAAILSVIIELLKALGVWDEKVAPYVNILGGIVWAALVLVIGQFPETETGIVWVLSLIMILVEVPIFSRFTYKNLVQPVTRKRFNKFDKEV